MRAGREEANSPIVLGANPDYSVANTHFVQDGRFFTDADLKHAARVCVIGTDVADALYPAPRPDRPGADHRTASAYRVIGLFEKKGSAFGGSNDNFVAIPITAFDEQFPEVKNGGGDTIHIATVPRRAEDFEALIEEETAILRARRGLRPNQQNDFAIFTSEGQLQNFQQITGGVAAAMIVIAGIALLVGGRGRDEHHARERDAADARDRPAQGARGDPARHRRAVPGGGRDAHRASAARSASASAWAWRSSRASLFDFEAAAPAWSVALGFGVSRPPSGSSSGCGRR